MKKNELMAAMMDKVIAKNNKRRNPLPLSRMDIRELGFFAACLFVSGKSDASIDREIGRALNSACL